MRDSQQVEALEQAWKDGGSEREVLVAEVLVWWNRQLSTAFA